MAALVPDDFDETPAFEPDELEILGELLKSGTDEDTLLKIAYETFLNRDFEFPQGERKDFSKATEKKHAGNHCFRHKQYKLALEHYNAAIIKCPQSTDEERELFSVLVANRSAIFYEWKKFDKVLRDIAFVEKIGNYPSRLKYKLSWRRAKCYEAQNNSKGADEAYEEALARLMEDCQLGDAERKEKVEEVQKSKLTKKKADVKVKAEVLEDMSNFQGDEKYIALNPSVDIQYDEKNGRYAVAKEDIPIGTLILKERAHVAVLIKEKNLKNCQHCLCSVDQPLPCPACANVVYCSPRCQEKAEKSYHAIECPVFGSLYECGTNIFLVLRIMSQKGFSFFINQKKHLLKLMKDEGCSGLSKKKVYHYDDYDTVMSLYRNDNPTDGFDIYVYSSTAYLLHALKHTNFFPFKTEENVFLDDELFIAKLILRHCKMANYNVHGLGEINPLAEKATLRNGIETFFEMVRIGVALYPTLSLFNHSCEPSIIRTNVNRKIYARTIKPIRAGDIIYDNYGFHYLWTPIEERHKNLEIDYCFKCACIACTEKWPCVEELGAVVNFPCKTKDCGQITTVTLQDPAPERCRSCHRRFPSDVVSKITAPIHKYLLAADELYDDKKYAEALKMFIKILNLMYRYTDKPDLDIARAQENIDFCLSHFGYKSTEYYYN